MYSVSLEISVVVAAVQQQLLDRCLRHRHCYCQAAAADHSDVVDTVDDDFVVVQPVTLTSILSYRLVMVLVALPLNLVHLLLRAVHYCHYYSGRFPAKHEDKKQESDEKYWSK